MIADVVDHFCYARSYLLECNIECNALCGSIRGFCSKDMRNVFFNLLFKTRILNNMHKETKLLPDSTSTLHDFLIHKWLSVKKNILHAFLTVSIPRERESKSPSESPQSTSDSQIKRTKINPQMSPGKGFTPRGHRGWVRR